MGLGTSGCAIPQPTLYAGASYENGTAVSPEVHLKVVSVLVTDSGITKEIQAGSPIAMDLEAALREFVTQLEGDLRGVRTKPEAPSRYDVSVSLNYVNSGLKASDAAAAFATGFFTLGLFGHIIKYDITYTTTAKIAVRRPDSTTRSYNSQAIINGKIDANRPPVPQHVAIMHEATQQCFRTLRDQIQRDVGPGVS